ncbi:hypothetical protein A7K94_0213215 [Modestobacter sp. VKM Ac-2676]|nr:hypothetical protein A7K94_0213215 [Modestobacter sp. VKM Ac-2676]
MTASDRPPLNRWERAAEQDRQRSRDEARAHVARPFGQFLVVQLAWGCLGAVLGLLLGSWTYAVVNFVVFAGAGLVAREFVRRRYARDRGPEG